MFRILRIALLIAVAGGAWWLGMIDREPLANSSALAEEPRSSRAKFLLIAESTDGQRSSEGGYKKPAIDPVAQNGEIFVGWPKPTLAMIFTGEMDGYLEPCGCAGLENQKGGLKRRLTLLNQLADKGWPLVKLDAGGLVKRVGPQAEIKYRYAVESLIDMGYAAIGFGTHDLQLSTDALAYVAANLAQDKNPLTSANAAIYDFNAGLSHPYRVVEAGGMRIGVVSLLSDSQLAHLKNSSEIVQRDPVQALTEAAPQLAAQQCDLQILMVHGSPDEARRLAQQFSQFDYVVATGGAEEPPTRLERIEGTSAILIECGHKGMYAVVVGLFEGEEPAVRYQRVPLDARFEDAPLMQRKLVEYQQELATLGLAGLGLKGSPHPESNFVGSEACADCHTNAWAVFEETPHAHATDTLVKLDPPRHFDPECLSCHVTGWHPQQYFPYESGYFGLEETPDLTQNGCENCHGPGGDHVAAEWGEEDLSEAEIESRRAAMRMEIVENEGNKEGQVYKTGSVVDNCMQCHDLDNSPDFDFQEYWPKVRHEGND